MSASEPFVRPLRHSDAPAVLAAFRSNPDMARQGQVTTSGEAEQYVTRVLSDPPKRYAWAIESHDALVGLIGVVVDEQNRNGWIWYWMTDAARGRGWTGRAVATVAHWALTDAGLERLELGHRVNNPASGGVARAAGFIREGTEREKFLIDGTRIDVATYGRVASDPHPASRLLPMRDN